MSVYSGDRSVQSCVRSVAGSRAPLESEISSHHCSQSQHGAEETVIKIARRRERKPVSLTREIRKI